MMPLTEEEKKERQLEANKRYYEKKKQKKKEYYEKNKEKIIEKMKEYQKKNKEYMKEYRQTPERKKQSRINRWKHMGIVPPGSWDKFHDEWEKTTNCDDCGVVMTVCERYNTKTTKCVDHDHSITDGRPNLRGFVCTGCNTRRG